MGRWAKDATRICNLCVENLRYPQHNVNVLNENGGPTKEEVLRAITMLKQSGRVGPKDVFIFYFSGHGIRDNDTFNLCTKGSYLSHKEVIEAVDTLGVERKIFVLDTCYSGGFKMSKTSSAKRVEIGGTDFTGHGIEAFFTKGITGSLVMTAASAHEKAPVNSAFTQLFIAACETIIREKALLHGLTNTKMCVRPLTLFDTMEELRKTTFPEAPAPRISDVDSLASFPIGPL